jgi:hypothetical protein
MTALNPNAAPFIPKRLQVRSSHHLRHLFEFGFFWRGWLRFFDLSAGSFNNKKCNLFQVFIPYYNM